MPVKKSRMPAKKTRRYGKAASTKVEAAMKEQQAWHAALRPSSGKKVTSRKQAVAIGLSQARRAGAKVAQEAQERPRRARGARRHRRVTDSPANDWPTGISSTRLTFTRSGQRRDPEHRVGDVVGGERIGARVDLRGARVVAVEAHVRELGAGRPCRARRP